MAVAGAYRDLGGRAIADGVDADVVAVVGDDVAVRPAAIRETAWYLATGLPAVTRSPSLRSASAGMV